MMQNLQSDITEKAIQDKDLMQRLNRVYDTFKRYMNQPYDANRPSVAYFSMEYGLSHVLKIYSGALAC